jgi:hypothetical protein
MGAKMRGEIVGRQQGLSFWGLVWGAALFVLLSIVLVKTIPPYVNNRKLVHALEELASDPKIMTMHRRQMLRNLERMLNIDYADTVVNLNLAFKVKNLKKNRDSETRWGVHR